MYFASNYDGGKPSEDIDFGKWGKWESTGSFYNAEKFQPVQDTQVWIRGRATWNDGISENIDASKITFDPVNPDTDFITSYTADLEKIKENTTYNQRTFEFTGSYQGTKSSNSLQMIQERKPQYSVIIKKSTKNYDTYYLSDSSIPVSHPMNKPGWAYDELNWQDITLTYTSEKGVSVNHYENGEISTVINVPIFGTIYLHGLNKLNNNDRYEDYNISSCHLMGQIGQIWSY